MKTTKPADSRFKPFTISARATLGIFITALAIAILPPAAVADAADLPGIWREFETGGWHHDAKASTNASGGRRVSWFDKFGRATFLNFEVEKSMPDAVLFIRYSRDGKSAGALDVAFGPVEEKTRPENIPHKAFLKLAGTGTTDNYEWVWLPLGDLKAGSYMLVVRCPKSAQCGDLDVAGIVPDDKENRWMPPSECTDGKLVGPGKLLDAPRPSCLLETEEMIYLDPEQVPVMKDYETSWLGNTYGRGRRDSGNWVQNQIFAIHVMPDGTVYANSPWDEGGRECGIYKDGKVIGKLADTHSTLAGYSITSDGTYIYAGIKSGFVRRYHLDGKPARFPGGKRDGSCLPVGGDIKGPLGLAIVGDELYVSTLNPDQIAVYDLKTLTRQRSWDLPGSMQIAADTKDTLWVVQKKDDETARITRFTTDGKQLPQQITDVVKPTALAIDNQGRLMVADNGHDQQVIFYDITAQPKRTGTLGVRGGVFAKPRGKMAPDRFYGITAIGCDADGNIYVNSNGWTWSGTDLRKFSPDGKMLWQLQGLFFVDCVDADPQDVTQVFGVQERFEMDYDAAPGEGWQHVDYTLDPFTYPNDPRLGGAKGSSIRMITIQGKRFMVMSEMNGSYIWMYRFDGRIAVPCVAFAHAKPNWPEQAPRMNRWLWRDLNADGHFQKEEFTQQGNKRDGISGLFDANGDYWTPTWSEKIRHYPCKGLDANGIPIYDAEPASVVDRPGDFVDMERIEYIPGTDTMYISGYTPDWPRHDNQFIPAGTAIAAYANWTKGNRTPAWVTRLPYSPQPRFIAKAMSVAGDYTFVNYAGKLEQILVIRNTDGKILGRFVPGDVIANTHGDADLPWAVKAIERENGDYVIFVEDDRFAKNVMYIWHVRQAAPKSEAYPAK